VTPDNETIKLSQNIRNQTPKDAASHPGKITPNPEKGEQWYTYTIYA